MDKNRLLDVIIRCHDPSKMEELSYCLLTLYGQHYQDVQPIIVLQNFCEEDESSVQDTIDEFDWKLRPRPAVYNLITEEQGDFRSTLLNKGIEVSKGRYLAFLDYDDCVYQHAYEYLIGRLKKTDAAIAFGGIFRADVVPMRGFYFTKKKWDPFEGKDIYDFYLDNCFPIHSFIVDKSKVAKECLHFEESLSKNEDYLFLLRIVSRYKADTGGRNVFVGEHRVRTDGSNTISTEYGADQEKEGEWEEARVYINEQKRLLSTKVPIAQIARIKKEMLSMTGARNEVDNIARQLEHSRKHIEALQEQQRKTQDSFFTFLSVANIGALLGECVQRPFGFIEHIGREDDMLHIWGWAADQERQRECVSVLLLLDGKPCYAVSPDIARPDVFPGTCIDMLGFSFRFSLPEKLKNYSRVEMYGITKGGIMGQLAAHESVSVEDERQLAVSQLNG